MTNMTQGEILSALAPIETMISICEENCGRQYLVMNDVKMIMPFVNKAQKAAEKLSRFALDNFNSDDENKRELSRIVCYRFGIMHSNLNGIKFNGLIDDTSVDWLNNNIKSVKDLLYSINLVVPALPESANASSNDNEEQAARIKELEARIEELEKNQPEEMSEEDIDAICDTEEDNKMLLEKGSHSVKTGEEIEDPDDLEHLQARIKELEADLKSRDDIIMELEEEQHPEIGEVEWISCFDGFLDPNLNPQAIAIALREIDHPNFPKNERGYWWVFVTVLTEIHWIPKPNYKQALQWANLHFKCGWDWTKDNQFKFTDINAEIRSKPSSEWNKQLTKSTIGDYYGALAKTMKNTFVDVVNNNKLIDKGKFIKKGYQRINTGH